MGQSEHSRNSNRTPTPQPTCSLPPKTGFLCTLHPFFSAPLTMRIGAPTLRQLYTGNYKSHLPMKHHYNFFAQFKVAILSMTLASLFPSLCNNTDASGVTVPDRQTSFKYLTPARFTPPQASSSTDTACLSSTTEKREWVSIWFQCLREGNICEF